MSNLEIIEKAIKKSGLNITIKPNINFLQLEKKFYYPIIFSHEFARAFWSNKEVSKCCGEESAAFCACEKCGSHCGIINEWQFHLAKMVLVEGPLKYLEKFL